MDTALLSSSSEGSSLVAKGAETEGEPPCPPLVVAAVVPGSWTTTSSDVDLVTGLVGFFDVTTVVLPSFLITSLTAARPLTKILHHIITE